jgi:hypothetical protein
VDEFEAKCSEKVTLSRGPVLLVTLGPSAVWAVSLANQHSVVPLIETYILRVVSSYCYFFVSAVIVPLLRVKN